MKDEIEENPSRKQLIKAVQYLYDIAQLHHVDEDALDELLEEIFGKNYQQWLKPGEVRD